MTSTEIKAKAFDNLVDRIFSDQKKLESNFHSDYLDYVCVLNGIFDYAEAVDYTVSEILSKKAKDINNLDLD